MKIKAIIVTYYPNEEKVKEMVTTLQSCGVGSIVVDNSPDENALEVLLEGKANLTLLRDNYGIAKAQNIGTKKAFELGAEAVIFFDQDSIISRDAISNLIQGFVESKREYKVSAPIFIDEQKGFEYPTIKVNRFGFRNKIVSNMTKDSYLTDVVISSGTLVSKNVFDVVGMMDEDFFIDYVDTEWCLRCKKSGIPVEVNPRAKMVHSIGDKSIKLLFVNIPVHSPTRRYYRVRNSFLLFRKDAVPKMMAAREVIFGFIHQIVITLFADNKKPYLLSMFRGVSDGIIGTKGK